METNNQALNQALTTLFKERSRINKAIQCLTDILKTSNVPAPIYSRSENEHEASNTQPIVWHGSFTHDSDLKMSSSNSDEVLLKGQYKKRRKKAKKKASKKRGRPAKKASRRK